MSQTIQIYPKCKKPKWLKLGVVVHCAGEAYDEFVVSQIGENAVGLDTADGKYYHGLESITKLTYVKDKMEKKKVTIESLQKENKKLEKKVKELEATVDEYFNILTEYGHFDYDE